MRSVATCAIIVASACGGSKPPPVTERESGLDVRGETARLCAAAKVMKAQACGPFANLGEDVLTTCSVARHLWMVGYDECVVAPTCDAAQACIARVAAGYRGPTGECRAAKDSELALRPAGVTADEMATSYGRDDVTFASSPSTNERPIEVCGFPAVTSYFTRVTCKDGSHLPRVRLLQPTGLGQQGGRCGRWIDQYDVPCPEATYRVFVDAYRCLARRELPSG